MKLRGNKTLLKLLLGLGMVLVLMISVNIYSHFYIAKKFNEAVSNNDSLPYTFGFKHLQVNVWTGYICAKDLYAYSKTDSANMHQNIINLNAASLRFSGIDIPGILFKKTLRIKKICFEHPILKLKVEDSSLKQADTPVDLFRAIHSRFDSMHIGSFVIENGEAAISGEDSADLLVQVPQINLNWNDIRIDSSLAASGKTIESGDVTFALQNIHGHLPGALYSFSVPSLSVNSKNSLVTIDSILLNPAVDKKKFGQLAGYQTDCITLKVSDIHAYSGRLQELIEKQVVYVDSLEAGALMLSAYRDKNIPRKPKTQELPVMLLKKLPFQLTILKTTVHRADVTYEELAEGASQSGHITFNKVEATALHLTNETMEKDTLILKAKGYMMNEAEVASEIQFPLASDQFFTSVDMNAFDMKLLNPMIMNFAPVKIVDGKAKSVKMWFGANSSSGAGQMTFIYSDLQVGSLTENKSKANEVLNSLKNFVANDVILQQNNPNPKDNLLRVGKVEYKRNPRRSIINYVWNLTFSGFKSSIGLKEEKFRKQYKMKPDAD